MKKIKQIIKIILKNILAFVVGGIVGAILSFILMKPLLIASFPKDVGLGIIGLAPVMMIMYVILFSICGGVLGVVIFNITKFIQRKRRKRNESVRDKR